MLKTKIANSFYVFVSVISSVLFVAPTVSACDVYSGDPWYDIQATVTDNPLAEHLILQPNEDGTLTVNASGLTDTLYIVAPDLDSLYPGYHTSQKDYRPLDEQIGHDYEPRLKIEVNADGTIKGIYRFSSGWGPIAHGGQDGGAKVSIFALTNNQRQQQKGGGRPDGVAIPADDPFVVRVVYAGSVYSVKGAIKYSLNENYNSRAESDHYANTCDDASRLAKSARDQQIKKASPAIILLLGVVLIVVSGYLIKTLHPWDKQKGKKQSRR